MKQNKIAIVTMDYVPAQGGIAVYWSQLYTHLSHDRFMLVAPDTEVGGDAIRVPFFFTKKMWPRWLQLFFSLRSLQKTHQFTEVLAGQVLPVGTVAALLKKTGVISQYSISCHSMDIAHIRGRKRLLAGYILKHARLVIANSAYTKSLLQKQYGISDAAIAVVTPAPYHRPNREQVDQERTAAPVQLLSVGRLVRRKGFDTVLKILPRLWEIAPDLEYTIVGDGVDREYLEHMVHDILPTEKQSQVHFVGAVDDAALCEQYRSADIFVLPSRDIAGDVEGFGIVNLEASSFGLPVVVGNGGGVPETVLDALSGYCIDGTDEIALYDALARLIKDPELRTRMGKTGREYAAQFTWEKSADILAKACV